MTLTPLDASERTRVPMSGFHYLMVLADSEPADPGVFVTNEPPGLCRPHSPPRSHDWAAPVEDWPWGFAWAVLVEFGDDAVLNARGIHQTRSLAVTTRPARSTAAGLDAPGRAREKLGRPTTHRTDVCPPTPSGPGQ